MSAFRLPRGLYCILLWAVAALAQDRPLSGFQLTKWSQKDGLPGTAIRRIAQTPDGYLWLTTEAGLVRFDGVRFVSVPAVADAPNEAAGAMTVAGDGSLWVGMLRGGVVRVSHAGNTYYPPGQGLVDGQARAIFEDHNGAIWVGTTDGLSRLDRSQWHRFGTEEGFSGHRVAAIIEDTAGSIRIGSDAGVFQWKPEVRKFVPDPESRKYTTSLSQGPDGTIWVSDADRGLHPLHRSDRDSIQWGFGLALLVDRHRNVWVGSQVDGVRRIAGDGHHEELTIREGLSHSSVESVFEDREGNIWVGTQNGLNRLRPVDFVPLSDPHISESFLRDIAATSDGSLWVMANPTVYRLRNGAATVYPTPRDIQGTVFSADGSDPLLLGSTRYLSQLRGRRFVALPMPRNAPLGLISDIARDPSGALWLADYKSGLVRWDRGVLTQFPDFAGKSVRRVVVDRGNRVWVGARDGLWKLEQGRWRHYTNADGAVEAAIRELYLGRDGTLWAATSDKIIRCRNEQIASFSSGLPPGSINSMVEDTEDSLWVVHSAGLFRIVAAEFDRAAADSRHKISFRAFDESDGLPSPPPGLQGHFAARAADGTLWFALRNGAVSVNPAELRENRIAPPVVIEGAVADQRTISAAPSLRLPPRTRSLRIAYTALSLTAPGKVRFKIKLEGLDPDWIDQGTMRQASYTNLAPGKYRFRVIACNNDGLWNEAGAAWEFSIAPAFSQTAWFPALCAAVGLAFLAAAYRWRIRRIEIRNRALVEQRVAERTRVARELHDTLVQDITGLTLQIGGLSRNAVQPMKDRLDELRRDAEQCVREARQSVWNLRLDGAPSRDLAAQLRDCGEHLASGTHLRFALAVRGTPRTLPEHIEQQIVRIGREAITNAVRHSNAANVRAELRFEEDAVLLRVSDDGTGFDVSETTHRTGHWGLVTMRERARQIGAQFSISSSTGGTEVETAVSLAGQSRYS